MICNVYDEMMKPVAATNHIALQQRYEGLFFKEGGAFSLAERKTLHRFVRRVERGKKVVKVFRKWFVVC